MAVAGPAADLEVALAARDAERRRAHDATHWVFACRLRSGDARFDDDGEPSGTAGRPILSAIEGQDLSDTVVVVTRWYGGTKLGTGGLARAYGDAAAAALDRLPVRHMLAARKVEVRAPYPDAGAVQRLVDAVGGTRLGDDYGVDVHLVVAIPYDRVDGFVARIRDATAARASARPMQDTLLIPVDS